MSKKSAELIDAETGEVLVCGDYCEGYKSQYSAVVSSFKNHTRYERNDGKSLCDGTPPMTVAQMYDYFVSQGRLPYNLLSDAEMEQNESRIENDEPINQYEDMDDLIVKNEYLNSISSKKENKVEVKGEVKQSETTTETTTEKNNIQENKKEE